MEINPDTLITDILKLCAGRRICVAYSGGVDSHVLLHLLATHRSTHHIPLRALHIHHGLQVEADQWAQHCAEIAAQLEVPFQTVTVVVSGQAEKGMEAAARDARYQALANNLAADEVLLTAQHQQDQAETVMLQLLRGAGPMGLAAMPRRTVLHGMTVIRPLLAVTKAAIMQYAQHQRLHWIDDPSNQDTQIYRNYLRHKVWPLLQAHWPALDRTLSRSAQHCEDSVKLLNDIARLDAQSVCPRVWHELDLEALKRLPDYRQRHLLRFAIEQSGLALPTTAILAQLFDTVVAASEDSTPLLQWANVQVRRFKQTLYLQTRDDGKPLVNNITVTDVTTIHLSDTLLLQWHQKRGQGLKLAVIEAGLTLRFRQGGERIRLQHQRQHHSLKHLFQQWQIPPWQRQQIPLLFWQDELVAVVGYAYAEGYAADKGEIGWLAEVRNTRF